MPAVSVEQILTSILMEHISNPIDPARKEEKEDVAYKPEYETALEGCV